MKNKHVGGAFAEAYKGRNPCYIVLYGAKMLPEGLIGVKELRIEALADAGRGVERTVHTLMVHAVHGKEIKLVHHVTEI